MTDAPMNRRSFNRSHALYERALKTVPTATQTFSKSALNLVFGASPLFLERGQGARVWDVDGNEFIDFVLGLLPVVLGYCDPDVDAAIRRQLEKGIAFSLATELEAELAERLVRLIPCAEKVRFGKNGSDATSAAVRLARAYTGRDGIAVAGYHGWHDWYIGSTTRDLGVPRAVRELTHRFAYNDAGSLEDVLTAHAGDIAAIVLEPATLIPATPGFLEDVRTLADRHGALLVFDEIISGFRIDMGGAQAVAKVTPDLACFGKAMANGMPISAICGRDDVMGLMDEIFFSGTFGGETLSLAAAIATIDKLEALDGPARMAETGAFLGREINALIASHDLSGIFEIKGPDWWPMISIAPNGGIDAALAASLLRQELIQNGVFVGGTLNLCLAHCEPDIRQATLTAWAVALADLNAPLKGPNPEQFLAGDIIKPVFKVRG